MLKFRTIFCAFSLLALISACGSDHKADSTKSVSSGIDLSAMDTTVDPKEDFYRYANGNWLKTNKIPANETKWSEFTVLGIKNMENLRELLKEISANKSAAPGSNNQKVRDFYLTAMDSVKLNKDGFAPIVPFIDQISAIKDKRELTALTVSQHLDGISAIWDFRVMPDLKNSSVYSLYLSQDGLGLPDPDNYTKKDPENEKLRSAYLAHLARMFEACGNAADASAKMAKTVVQIETELARSSMNATEQRDIQKQYNPMSVADLQKLCPAVDWNAYMRALGLKDVGQIIVGQPEFFTKVNTMLNKVSLDDWKVYHQWKLIDQYAMVLSDKIYEYNFDFYGRTMNGAKEIKPRWRRSLEMLDALLGEALGSLYIERYFSKEAKAKTNELVDNLMSVYSERIKALDWMNDSTKQRALDKLSTITRKLAYPDRWIDYSPVTIGTVSLADNFRAAIGFQVRRNLNKYGQPVDKTEWAMSVSTVNAYYNPSMNEIVFPAGILQPGFFDPNADDAANYAKIGTVIGHEITHGFDDQGAQFDKDGNMVQWWTEADKKKFDEKIGLVIKQYDAYTPLDTMHINGSLTVGENVADLGGFTMSYYAYMRSLNGKERKVIDGFTPEQRFFIAGAQMWRSLYTDESMRRQLETNPHAPGEYRVIGPFSNMPEFYAAFGVKKGNKMYRDETVRAKIW